MVWYHCVRSGLVLSAIMLFPDWRVGVGLGCGVVARCTYHIPATPLQVLSRTTYPFFSTIKCVAVNVAVQPSSHILPMEISAPDWRWGKMCDVLALVDNKGLRLISALWVAYIILPYGGITCSPWFVLTLFTQDVSTLMYFCVAPVSTIMYIGLRVGGFPTQMLHSLVFCI